MSRPPITEMINGFIEEVKSYIPALIDGLESLKGSSDRSEALEKTHRLVHTVKGASSMVGLAGLSQIALQMEEYLDDIIAGNREFTDEAFTAMHRTIDLFQEYCRGYLDGGVDSRAMLKETVLAFRRARGQTTAENEQKLTELLESIPENEKLNTGGAVESEKGDEADLESIEAIAALSADADGSNSLFETGAENNGYPVEPQAEIETALPPKQTKTEVPAMLLESFYEEAEAHLEDLGRSLNVLETEVEDTISISPSLKEEIRRIRRSVHTLKGAAAVIGLRDFSAFAHSLEDLLDWLYEDAGKISPEIIKMIVESADLLERIVSKPDMANSAGAHSLKTQYRETMGLDPVDRQMESSTPQSETQPDRPANPAENRQAKESGDESKEPVLPEEIVPADESADPAARFTRTLRVDPERVDDLVNLTGELIIALSAFDQKMELFKDTVNDIELSRDRLKKIARDLEVSYEVKALEELRTLPDFKAVDFNKAIPAGKFEDFDSLELDRYSELNLIIRMLNESTVDVGALHTQLMDLHSDLDGRLTRQRVILSELQDKVMRVRMTPMSFIANKLRRTVREVAGNVGKRVQLVITGENIELDKLIWEKLTDPLMHLLRNAVDHGVEPADIRQARGKAPVATVKVEASREGNQVVIRVADDGAGLNYRAIQAAALRMRLCDNVEELSEDELSQFIFHPGFSTRADISQVSGRGVGMDVVKENIQDLKGVIRVASDEGQGTQFSIRIPLTLAAMRALLFNAGGQTFAVALNEVSEIVRLNPEKILGPSKDALRLNDEVLPLFNLLELLNREPVATPEYPLTLVVESGGRRYALVIDGLVGQREIVIKSLGTHLRHVKGVSGATIMGDGSVVPILNLDEFVWTQTTADETTVANEKLVVQRPLEIMVVDDSISIRQVVSRLMEDQGWMVQTAKDGIDAMEKLRENRPDLIVLDIEMPRMNGYELLGALKVQADCEDIPVIMLTSRTAAKHREKAMALGAKGFMVKPYNDDDLIRRIHQLTGRVME